MRGGQPVSGGRVACACKDTGACGWVRVGGRCRRRAAFAGARDVGCMILARVLSYGGASALAVVSHVAVGTVTTYSLFTIYYFAKFHAHALINLQPYALHTSASDARCLNDSAARTAWTNGASSSGEVPRTFPIPTVPTSTRATE